MRKRETKFDKFTQPVRQVCFTKLLNPTQKKFLPNRKNKNKSKISINKYKYKTPDEEFLVCESNDDNDADNDGLDRIFNNGNKTKY